MPRVWRVKCAESGSGWDEGGLCPPQGCRRRALDADVDQRASLHVPAEVDGPAPALDEHLLDAANPFGIPPRSELLNDLDESLDPLRLDLFRHLVVHRRRL